MSSTVSQNFHKSRLSAKRLVSGSATGSGSTQKVFEINLGTLKVTAQNLSAFTGLS